MTLHAPWRMEYLKSIEHADQSAGGCFICQAIAALDQPAQRRARLVLWATPHVIVMMNRFPYASGHLLVSPRSHLGELYALSHEELVDLQIQTAAAVRLVERAVSPQGFNIGINQGRAAGAGLPAHLHQHVVPRWGGDVNFISVVGTVRVQPQAMEAVYEQLLALREKSAV
ncbi:MAG TPA: HIT domain-containing protein [Tepidisphaeraceae bacterium]|jgi:ATP adenylyltransferase